ncbi:hypothetical protein TNCV_5009611 [Trichonephila clavipes]|nr:hypothetical protein TNCV_5009611 [Trichonephila clavipes]
MATKEDFPPLPTSEKYVSRTLTDSMETDLTPPTAEDLTTCSRLSDVFEYEIIKESRLAHTQQILVMMDTGILRKNQENYDLMEKEVENLTAEMQDLKGELTLIGTCPILNCHYHPNPNPTKNSKKPDDYTK